MIGERERRREKAKLIDRFVTKGGSVGGKRNWMKMVKRYKIHIR